MKHPIIYKAIMLICFFMIAVSLPAQNNDKVVLVKARVVDSNGEPLQGAVMKISGKAQGAVADSDGLVSAWVETG